MKFIIVCFTLMMPCTFCAQKIRAFPLEKVGSFIDSSSLNIFYTQYARPLIIINSTIYIPHDRCVDLRSYGGSYVSKDLEGNTIVKSEGGDLGDKTLDGEIEEKNLEGDELDKSTGGGEDLKSRGAENERKDHKGEVNLREKEGGVVVRKSEGSDSDKTLEGSEIDKTSSGAMDERSNSASNEQKNFGGYTLYVKCYEENNNFSLHDYFSDKKIKIFDINGLREVTKINIVYDQ